MPHHREVITEQEAVEQWLAAMLSVAFDNWPAVHDFFTGKTLDKPLIFDDEEQAKVDLWLALISAEIQAVDNLFPKGQAARLRKWAYMILGESPEFGEYRLGEIRQYEEAFHKGIEDEENPMFKVVGRLLHKWLGENIRDYTYEWDIDGERGYVLRPVVLMTSTHFITSMVGSWKRISDNLELVQGEGGTE